MSVVINNKTRFVIVLPCWGSPYVLGHYNKDNTAQAITILNKAVGGPSTEIDVNCFIIHPMFARDNKRWNLAARLLNMDRRCVRVFVNAEGEICGPNMGTVRRNRDSNGCPHLMGDVALVVSGVEILRKEGLGNRFPDCLTLEKNPVSGDEIWEFEDDEEIEKFKKLCDEKGFDFNEETGQCYSCRIVS